MPKSFISRLTTLLLVSIAAVAGFYASLVFSAAPLSAEERLHTFEAIQLLEEKGFADEAFLLKRIAVFRSNDNWLNASVEKENAFAATNFPFGIVTLYPEFFKLPVDGTERAAILLHEARHIKGEDEKAAYEYVWKNRALLGWNGEKYENSEVWRIVEKQTREYAPLIFICEFNQRDDCTAAPKIP